jgi:hypothetical protein
MHKFPSIESFKSFYKQIKSTAYFTGMDEEDKPIYDITRMLPTLTLVGTVKLHGTNAGVYLDENNKVVCMSRSRVLSNIDDNMGFATHVHKPGNHKDFKELLCVAETQFGEPCVIFGEWCGEGIQKGVGISTLSKRFVYFAVKGLTSNTWFDITKLRLWTPDAGIDTITSPGVFTIIADMSHAGNVATELNAITQQVENECPYAKLNGATGIGEGLVWHVSTPGYTGPGFWFKTKGERHKVTVAKAPIEMTTEKADTIMDFVEMVVTEARLEQGVSYLRENNLPLDKYSLGPYIKWIKGDIWKEELERMEISGLGRKDVGAVVSSKSRAWFLGRIREAL